MIGTVSTWSDQEPLPERVGWPQSASLNAGWRGEVGWYMKIPLTEA